MAIPAEYSKWVVASIYNYFEGVKGGNYLLLDNEERPQDLSNNRFEVRIIGPSIDEVQGQYMLEVDLSILIVTIKSSNLYSGEELVGAVQNMMQSCIPVKKLVDGDGSTVGQLIRITKIDSFKMDTIDNRFTNTVLEATYSMEVDK